MERRITKAEKMISFSKNLGCTFTKIHDEMIFEFPKFCCNKKQIYQKISQYFDMLHYADDMKLKYKYWCKNRKENK